jgi:Cu(I)/Ag(I) efflux system membrane protein CusA/SilA
MMSVFSLVYSFFVVDGCRSDVMLPITIPLIGGLFTSTVYALLVTVIFEMTKNMN